MRSRADELGRATVRAALGPCAILLDDDAVTDILINGERGVWMDRGAGLEPVGRALSEASSVRRLAVRLAGLADRRLDDASPWVDGLLPGGIRLHAVLPPLVEGGPHISLRLPRHSAPSLADLTEWGALDRVSAHVITAIVRERLSFVISGGTGSGKTTLLGAMLGAVGHGARLVVVEDTRELQVDHPHVVYLQGRANNVEGRGEVTLATLVRQSLRMRPDRLVVGEVRGGEVRELLAALNTGHEGGCGTVHANTAADVVPRLEALGALAAMSQEAVHAQLASAIEVVLHVGRRSNGDRVLSQVGCLRRGRDGRVGTTAALVGGPGAWVAGPAWTGLAERLELDPKLLPVSGVAAVGSSSVGRAR